MKRNKTFNKEDYYILNNGRLFLPTKDNNDKNVLSQYQELGIKIDDSIEMECVCLNPPKGWKAYMDYAHFESQHGFVKGYHSVIVDEKDNVVIRIWTKRFGMRMLEFECLEIIKE